MGSWTELYVAGYPLIYSKGTVIPDVMTVFRESDRREIITTTPSIRDGHDSGEPEIETKIEYTCSIEIAIDRLNIMGFTLGRARDEFEGWRIREVQELAGYIEDGDDWAQKDLTILNELSFDKYSELIQRQIATQPEYYNLTDEQRNNLDPTERYFLLCDEGVDTPLNQ